MREIKFREAKVLYEILEKHPRLFSTNPVELIDKIEQLKRGLPKENEFISLCSWMDNCALIHKLDQEQMPKWTKDYYQVPDLFAVFKYDNNLIPVLIEVKSQEKLSTKNSKLIFSEKYYNKINAYSRLNKLPLLLAWKIGNRGMWILVDIAHFEKREKAYHLELGTALKEDLKCVLLGDFSIRFRPNINFVLKSEMVTQAKIRNSESNGMGFGQWKIVEAFFQNYKKEHYTKIPYPLMQMLSYSSSEQKEEIIDKYFFKSIEWPHGEMIFASMLHGLACMGGIEAIFNSIDINWAHVIFNEDYKFNLESIVKCIKECMDKGFIHIRGFLLPKTKPNFIVGDWPPKNFPAKKFE